MYICHCHGVTDHTLLSEIERGACSLEAIGSVCGAGTACGGCQDLLNRLLVATGADPAATVAV